MLGEIKTSRMQINHLDVVNDLARANSMLSIYKIIHDQHIEGFAFSSYYLYWVTILK